MNIFLPLDYIIESFYRYAGYAKRKNNKIYWAGCVSCREGSSWKKKKRLYLILNNTNPYLYCFNCNRSWSPINWIMEVSGKTYFEILKEIKEYTSKLDYYNKNEILQKTPEKILNSELLKDSINLFDKLQIEYYKDNKVIKDALEFINKRRLNTLINHPQTFYISLNDEIHKNRLIIPFYDLNNKITFYQTRAIYPKDEVDGKKYLSKLDAHKGIYGINNIDDKINYLFPFEGPIDAMSVKNGISIAGINVTDKQKEMLDQFMFYKKIYVFDNQYIDKTSREKTQDLIEAGETVFIWPKEYKQKDFNEICCDMNLDQISPKFILKNSFSKEIALLKIKVIF